SIGGKSCRAYSCPIQGRQQGRQDLGTGVLPLFCDAKGNGKETALSDFANVRKGGIIAIGIEPGDTLIEVKLTTGHDEVVLITKEGMSIRFSEEDVRSMGRPAGGVRGISLEPTDSVVALAVLVQDATLLVAGENGIGKRTD